MRAAESPPFEVWVLDQADTHSEGGGLLYIWDGTALSTVDPNSVTPQVIDMAKAATDAKCPVSKRPHMVLANYGKPPTHMIISNVGSGDVQFMDIKTRAVVGCVRTVNGFEGAGGSKADHAAYGSPDNSMVLVSDTGPIIEGVPQSGFLHKIQTDYATNTYKLVETLPLAPYAKELGTAAARPICHEFTADSKHAYITMAGGGVLVVDTGSAGGKPAMSVKKVYPASKVPGIGCGVFRLSNNTLLTNGESGAKGGNDFLFIFDASKIPAAFPDPIKIDLPGEDTHGVAICTDREGKQFAWSVMRVSNEITVVDLQTHQVVKTMSLVQPFSPDPKPDISDIVGNKMFVVLRGAKPLTAIDSLPKAERTPGLAVLTVGQDCKSFEWDKKSFLSMGNNPNKVTVDGKEVNAADPHGLETVSR
jgi:hypothetical protein